MKSLIPPIRTGRSHHPYDTFTVNLYCSHVLRLNLNFTLKSKPNNNDSAIATVPIDNNKPLFFNQRSIQFYIRRNFNHSVGFAMYRSS